MEPTLTSLDPIMGSWEEPPRRRRSAGRRVAFWLGLVALLAGAGWLGYLGWQFYGTNIVARHKQAQNVERLTELWQERRGPSAESGRVPLGQASALIRIPRFGDGYVMPVLEGISDKVLSQGFGHFEDSADPGRRGNYALAAHRVTHGEPLRRMPDLRPGDEVLIETRHALYTYVLDTDPEDLVVDFTQGWVVDPFPVNPRGGVGPDPARGRKLLTLTTCASLFHTDSRMIAFGHLEKVERKQQRAEGTGA